MKAILTLSIIALAWIAGYLAEPSIRPHLLPKKGDGEGVVVVTPKIDLNKLTPDQIPATVTLMEDVAFTSPSKLSITIPAGTSVKVKNIQSGRVYVMLEDTSTSIGIPFEKTNLMAQVVSKIDSTPAPGSIETNTPTTPQPVTVATPTPEAIPVAPPVTPPTVTEAPVVTPPVTPEPVQPPSTIPPPPATTAGNELPPPPPAPTPTPAPAVAPGDEFPNDGPAPLVAAGALDDKGLVLLMQQHIKSGSLKTFAFEQVTSWKAGPTENINGTPVQTGTVTYTHQTIFGPKQLTAKAYMLRGRVLRWVWPESGLVLE